MGLERAPLEARNIGKSREASGGGARSEIVCGVSFFRDNGLTTELPNTAHHDVSCWVYDDKPIYPNNKSDISSLRDIVCRIKRAAATIKIFL